MTEIFDCYVERPTKEEAIEIVERAVSNGVECWDAVGGMDVTAKGGFYEYDEFDFWGICAGRGIFTHGKESIWAKSATKLTMDEYRAKFPCEKYDVKQDEWPKSGDEVLALSGVHWKCTFIGFNNEGYAVCEMPENYPHGLYEGFSLSVLSKPKTDRERFIEAALATKSAHMWTETESFGALYDAVFKAPENNNENT